jgi:predicted transposase YdaD
MELTTSWKEEGIQQGIQQGLQQGKYSQALAIVLRLLRRRIGLLPDEVEAHIKQLSLTQQETLAEDLLDFTGLADVEAWLDAHPPAPPAADVSGAE